MIYDEIDPITINMRTYLSVRGIDLDTDITSAVFMIKTLPADSDAAALVTKTLGAGIVKDADTSDPVTNDRLLVYLSPTDFGSGALEIGSTYYFGVGVKRDGDAVYFEPPLEDNRVTVVADFIHD